MKQQAKKKRPSNKVSRAGVAPKFVQITAVFDNFIAVYALDEDGRVWVSDRSRDGWKLIDNKVAL